MDNIGVLVAVIVMVLMALVIVSFKVGDQIPNEVLSQATHRFLRRTLGLRDVLNHYIKRWNKILFDQKREEKTHFSQVDSTIMYTGHGYIPCEG